MDLRRIASVLTLASALGLASHGPAGATERPKTRGPVVTYGDDIPAVGQAAGHAGAVEIIDGDRATPARRARTRDAGTSHSGSSLAVTAAPASATSASHGQLPSYARPDDGASSAPYSYTNVSSDGTTTNVTTTSGFGYGATVIEGYSGYGGYGYGGYGYGGSGYAVPNVSAPAYGPATNANGTGFSGASPSINASGSPLINPGAATPSTTGGVPNAAPGSGFNRAR